MKTFKKMWQYLKPYKKKIYLALFLLVFAAVLTAAAPITEGMITTQLQKDVTAIKAGVVGARIQKDIIIKIIAVLFSFYLVNTSSRIALQYLISDAIQSAIYDMRAAVKQKMTQLPIKYFDTHSAGDLMSRMTSDMDTISGALQQSFSQVMMALLNMTFAIIMIYFINVKMALIATTLIPLSYFMSRYIVSHSQKMFKATMDSLGVLNSVVQEKFTGFNEIKLYNYQEDAIADFDKANDELCNNAFKGAFVSGLMSPAVSLMTYIVIAIIIYMGVINVMTGVLLVGSLQAFIRYIWQINQPLMQMTNLAGTIQSSVAAMDRIFEYLEESDDVQDLDVPTEIGAYKGAVQFDHVNFGYDSNAVIKDLSVDIKPGELVAIVGPTGAGKTTIINLLTRFYDVDSGSIKIDGTDIRHLKRDDLRSLFGMVLQDTWLFSGKIKENIAYGKEGATDKEIIEAAKRSNVHHFIKTLPDGYDMVLNEESSNISNGEKQLITIARALLSDPRILILDEATSSVDTRLDAMIQEAMANLMQGRTSFVIAHRLSTIRNADKILVMNDGNIIEMGNHDELMDQNGFYADLYLSQFADYEA